MNDKKTKFPYCTMFYLAILLISVSIVSFIGVLENKKFYSKEYILNGNLDVEIREYCNEIYRFINNMSENEMFYLEYEEKGIYYYVTDKPTNDTFTNIPNYIDKETLITDPDFITFQYVDYKGSSSNLFGYIFCNVNSRVYSLINKGFYLQKLLYMKMIIFSVSLILGSILLIKSYKNSIDEVIIRTNFIPIDVKIFTLIVGVIAYLVLNDSHEMALRLYWLDSIISSGVALIIVIFIILIIMNTFIFKIKNDSTVFKTEWENRLTKNIHILIYRLIKRVPIWIYVLILHFLFYVTIIATVDMGSLILLPHILVIVAIIIINKIQKNKNKYIKEVLYIIEEIAKGNFEKSVPVVGNSVYAQISNKINKIRDEYIVAIEEEKRSERLKYELVTNISHDLRTPLTSILNYIELAKREVKNNDEIEKYISHVEINANRLNILVEDLFELTKMESGNIKLEIVTINIVLLTRQIINEYTDQLKQSGLEVVFKCSNEYILWDCDSLKIYRLLDNIIYNAIKYSVCNTRIYVDIKNEDDLLIITIKNISNYRMDFEANELFSRFKRGDESRATDGSGLGLAIAKSIVELHNGNINIEIEGDMFKVMIEFNILHVV